MSEAPRCPPPLEVQGLTFRCSGGRVTVSGAPRYPLVLSLEEMRRLKNWFNLYVVTHPDWVQEEGD